MNVPYRRVTALTLNLFIVLVVVTLKQYQVTFIEAAVIYTWNSQIWSPVFLDSN